MSLTNDCFRDPDVNTTSYMDADKYKAIWRKLDKYNRLNNYSLRPWEMIESALNSTLHELFVPTGADDDLSDVPEHIPRGKTEQLFFASVGDD